MLPYILALVIGLGSFAFYMAAFFFPEVHRKNDFIWSGVGLFYALVLWVCAGRITGGVLLGQMASVAVLGWLGWQTLTLRRELASPEQRTEISPQVEAQIKRFSLDGLGSQLLEPLTGLFRKKPVKTIVLRSPETQTTAPKEPTPSVEAPPTDVTTDTQDVAVPVEEEVVVKTYPAEASQEIVEETPPPVEAIAPTTEETPLPVEAIAPTAEETPPPVEAIAQPEPEIPPPTPEVKPVEQKPTSPATQKTGRFQQVSGLFKNLFSKTKPSPRTAATPTTPPEPQPLPEEESDWVDETPTPEAVTVDLKELTEPTPEAELTQEETPPVSETVVVETVTVEVEVTEPTTPVLETDQEESQMTPETATVEAATPEVSEPTPVLETPLEEPEVESSTEPESPKLIRPNPPDPKLVEAAKKSTTPDQPESSEG